MDDLLLIDKPAGWTSHDVVAKLRGILKTRKIGHAGTLDPFATGLLLIGVGSGTKQLHHLQGQDKTYETIIWLGATSTTFDTEGEITPTPSVVAPTQDDVERALETFRGGYEQKAPLYSAKKIKGRKLYDLARTGRANESMRPTKHVSIHELTVLDYHFPELRLRVRCGSGTYIRSLANDIGAALGIGGYALALRRTSIGAYTVHQSKTLEDIPHNH